MFRFALSAIALVGALEIAHPAFADPLAAMAADPAQVAAAQPASPPPAPSSDATAAASTRHDKAIAPAGFGWG